MRSTFQFLLLFSLLSAAAWGSVAADQAASSPIRVDGVKYSLTQAGVQQAFNDACALSPRAGTGADVYLPPGTITLAATSGQQFLIECALHVHGPGVAPLWFVATKGVPKTVPIFRVRPASPTQGWFIFENFRIAGQGSVGGDAFFLDASKAAVNHFTLQNVQVTGLAPESWSVNMSASTRDSLFLGRIFDSDLAHGIKMNSASTDDSWLIEHNTFNSVSGGTTPCLDATTERGAAHITMFNNNGGCTGGFFISHGTTQCQILYNQIEQPANSTEANSAVIDLIGDTYNVNGCKIIGNNINAHKFAKINIRLGSASNTVIDDNVIPLRAGDGVGIDFTPSSSNTILGFRNQFAGVGGGAVAMAGAGTHFNLSRILVGGPAPTCSITGFGSGATCSPQAGSSDSGGQLSFAPGTAPASHGTISLNFSSSYGTNAAFCVFMPVNGGQGWNPRASLIGASNDKTSDIVNWDNNGVAFSGSGSIAVHYWCGGR
ncbi:MAG: hypothetical protein WA672_15985 [Candidatus Angelobacter sp.]